jgi:hypothetical protein
MNNKSEKQESSNDLRPKLLRNLEETGYPVELRVGNIFASCGFNNLEHNRYYIDEDEQKGREIDICAYTNVSSPGLSVGLGLICEVTKSPKYPWVIFSTERQVLEGEGWLRLHFSEGQLGSTLLPFDEIESKATTKQFARIGRSYHECFKSPNAKSSIFEALITASKAAEYWLKREIEFSKEETGRNIKHRSITFVDPLIVLDGALYEAYLDEDSQIKVDEVTHIPVSFGYISAKYSRYGYLIDVVTIEELPILLTKKREWITYMHNSIARKLRK